MTEARAPFAAERRALHLSRFRTARYWIGSLIWLGYFVFPLGPGWLGARALDEVANRGPTATLAVLLAVLVGSEGLAAWLLTIGHRTYMEGVSSSKALMQTNAVRGQLASGGPQAAPRLSSVGDAVARLRDDPNDVMMLLDNWLDLSGSVLYGAVAAAILASIDPLAALVGIMPLVVLGFANSAAGQRVTRYRRQARAATSDVGAFLTTAMEASLSIKVAGARPGVLRRLDQLNDRRAAAMVRDQVWADSLFAVNGTLTDICVGLALIVAARGRLSAGEVALFTSYLFSLVWLPQRIGDLIVGRRRFAVSAGRLDELAGPGSGSGTDVDDAGPGGSTETGAAAGDPLTRHHPLPVLGGPPAARPTAPARRPLERLELRAVTVAGRGVRDVDLVVERSTLTVVCGPVGSGKSSLLAALVGLIPLDGGEVRWNGEVVEDRAAFFVPPQCGYVAQVPRLFAEPLADNLRLSYAHVTDAHLDDAVRLAALDRDVAGFPAGLATLVGARGVRLSGGQVQRAAAARALAQRPELLVFDDLASALDVRTEQQLWDGLLGAGMTVIVATNRAGTLARADQVLALGRDG